MKRLLVLLAAVGVLGALFTYGILRDPTRRDDIPSALLDESVPSFTMPLFGRYHTEYGAALATQEVRGKPMVVNFWASWCAPCREEMPILQASWEEHRDQVLFVGVNTQERNADNARALLDEFQLTYPNGTDARNRINIDYGLFGLPETFFIRADGTLQYRHSGEISLEVLDAQLRALLDAS